MSKSWDNIPSVEGLEVDWDFEPENPLGLRRHERLSGAEVASLFRMKEIPIRIATERKQISAVIFDICEGGLAVDSPAELKINQPVKVGFFLGKKKIINRAVVKWVRKMDSNFRLGMMFVKLKEEDGAFISGIYGSKKISRY